MIEERDKTVSSTNSSQTNLRPKGLQLLQGPLLFLADFAEQLPHPTRLIAEEVLKGHDTTVKIMSV